MHAYVLRVCFLELNRDYHGSMRDVQLHACSVGGGIRQNSWASLHRMHMHAMRAEPSYT